MASNALKLSPESENIQPLESFDMHLSEEQFECLGRCAKGISLRFEASEIVDALVAGGYAEAGVARVVTISAMGRRYLQMRDVESRLHIVQAMR